MTSADKISTDAQQLSLDDKIIALAGVVMEKFGSLISNTLDTCEETDYRKRVKLKTRPDKNGI
jgi:hypothetical protein